MRGDGTRAGRWRPRWMGAMALAAAAAAAPSLRAQRAVTPAADPAAVRAAVEAWRAGHERDVLREFTALLAIPNVATDSADIRRNAAAIIAMFGRRGIPARVLEVDGGAPAVFAEVRTAGATRTVVFYAHYDGQPVDTTKWTTPPWSPVFRSGGDVHAPTVTLPPGTAPIDPDWRVFARSAGDDKAPVIGLLTALDALRAAKLTPSVNLKFFFEGEEEAGSPHIAALLQRHASVLTADAWVFCDGPVHQTGRPQIVFGARGVVDAQLTVYGPSRALHSGHYGNWAPNPIVLLSTLISGMRDDDGRILIDGYYDDVRPLSAEEHAALAVLPSPDDALRTELQLGATEAGGASLAERIALPALNLRGIQGGAVGALAANAIPTQAVASIDFRLVPDQTPAHVRALVEAHLRRSGWFVVHDAPDSLTRLAHARVIRVQWGPGYAGLRTPMSLSVSRALVRAVNDAAGGSALVVPTLGGSLPIHVFEDAFHVPLVILPIANYDDNQHAANENLRLGNLWSGIGEFAMVMARLGAEWSGSAAAPHP